MPDGYMLVPHPKTDVTLPSECVCKVGSALTLQATLLWLVVVVGDRGVRRCTFQKWTRFSKEGTGGGCQLTYSLFSE